MIKRAGGIGRLGAWVGSYSTNVWLLLANTVFVYFGLGIFALVLNLYLSSMGFREDYIGLFSFANTAATGAVSIPAGIISNRVGPRLCIIFASLVMCAAALSLGFITEGWMIVLLGGVFGASTALVFVPSGPFLMDNTEESQRVAIFSLNFAMMSLAQVMGSLVSGYLPGILSGTFGVGLQNSPEAYRGTLVIGALLLGLSGVPIAFATRTRLREHTSKPSSPDLVSQLDESEARRVVYKFGVSVLILALATGFVIPFYNVFLSKELGASTELIGIIYAVASLTMIPCSLAGPAMARRFGTARSIAILRLLTAPFMLMVPLLPTLSIGSMAYIARAGLSLFDWPIDVAFAMALMTPRLRAVQSGVRSASWNIGWALSSLIAGQLIVGFGYNLVFVLSGVLTIVGGLYYWFAIGPYEKPTPTNREPDQPVASTDLT